MWVINFPGNNNRIFRILAQGCAFYDIFIERWSLNDVSTLNLERREKNLVYRFSSGIVKVNVKRAINKLQQNSYQSQKNPRTKISRCAFLK